MQHNILKKKIKKKNKILLFHFYSEVGLSVSILTVRIFPFVFQTFPASEIDTKAYTLLARKINTHLNGFNYLGVKRCV